MIKHFSVIHDPRINHTKEHKLVDILIIEVVGAICVAESSDEIEFVAKSKIVWLKQYLELTGGIPSHDTIGKVMSRVSPLQLERAFAAWMSQIANLSKGEVIAIDGKTLRRSFNNDIDKPAIQMVSAWATASCVVLGQAKVDDKSNEITAIPKLLELLNLAGCVVTIDAMGRQKEIAQAIVDQKADYVLGLKGNQGNARKVAGLQVGGNRYVFPNDQGKNNDGDALLHLESQARSGKDHARGSRALGDRKQAALGVGCAVQRGPIAGRFALCAREPSCLTTYGN